MFGFLCVKSSAVLMLLIMSNAVAFGSENQGSEKTSSAEPEASSIETYIGSLYQNAKEDTTKVQVEVDSYGQKQNVKLTDLSADALKDLGARAHYDLAVISRFPSASQCADCHPRHYKEWAASPHAYAQLSPVFNSMQATFIERSLGTNGDFCIRCHSEVGMTLKEPLFTANANRSAVSRQGITCVVCHRIEKPYGRVSGRFGLEQGSIHKPMYGPLSNKTLKEVIERDSVSPEEGIKDGSELIHSEAEKRLYFSTEQICSMCHDVNSQNGFRLEAAYTQFLNSPAKARGETCQDCHMGIKQGIKSGYDKGPVAHVGGTPTPTKKITNHQFPGPDYSIIHPGIFPHSTEGPMIATFADWTSFDYIAGWGSDEFESVNNDGHSFPAAWQSHEKRRRAHDFTKLQIERLADIDVPRYQLLRRGYQFGKFKVEENSEAGIAFKLEVRNGTDGHNVPTGFDAERLIFVQVTVSDSEGAVVFQSGDRDPNGDVRDFLSRYVHNWEVPADPFLLNLQSEFLGLTIRGGYRSEILTVNFSQTALPFIRPNTSSSLLEGRPPATRKQVKSLAPNGTRWGEYEIDAEALTGRGPYTVNLKFISQMVPAHLVWDISGVGFDYGLSAKEIADRIVKGAMVLWEHDIVLDKTSGVIDLTPTEYQIMNSPPQQHKESWVLDLEQIF